MNKVIRSSFLLQLAMLLPILLLAQPKISSISPGSGAVGTTVTITGTNFDAATLANNIVFLGTMKAPVLTASATVLTVTVPVGATYAAVTVVNTATKLAGQSAELFMPTFSPSKGTLATTDFDAGITIGTGSSTLSSVAMGDIDGDGRADLVVSKYDATGKINILLNTGSSGTLGFAAPVNIGSCPQGLGLVIADLNGDGKLDLVVGTASSNNVYILQNTSTIGSVSFTACANLTNSGSFDLRSVQVADLNADGKPDVTCTVLNNNNFLIFQNTTNPATGIITFSGPTPRDYNLMSSLAAATGDLNGDGKPDIVIAGYSYLNGASGTGQAASPAGLYVLLNTSSAGGAITYSGTPIAINTGSGATQYNLSIAIGDLDGDGKPDLAIGNGSGSGTNGTGYLILFRNTTPSGSSTLGFVEKDYYFASPWQPNGLAIGDADGDGKPDVATAQYGGDTRLFHNSSTVGNISMDNASAPASLSGYNRAQNVAIGDLDGDGRPDMVSANQAYLFVYRNNPSCPAIATLTPVSICKGETATFTPAVTNIGGTLAYQWQYATALDPTVFTNVTNGTFGSLPSTTEAGATGASYTTTTTNSSYSGRLVRLTASNGCGTATVSTTALLTVNVAMPTVPVAGNSYTVAQTCNQYGTSLLQLVPPTSPTSRYVSIDANGNTGYSLASSTVSNNSPAVNYQMMTDGTHNTTALANQLWTVIDNGTGNYATNGGMVVRIYYDPADITAAEAALDGNVASAATSQWFKFEGASHAANTANILARQTAYGISGGGVAFLVPSSAGTENGVNYVEFSGITGFSSFGYMAGRTSAALPITLTGFAAVASGCTAQLEWQTATEQNSSYYAVEAGTDGINFKEVARVASKNSATGASYSYEYALGGGNTYFRLSAVDLDGSRTYSNTATANGTGACGTGLQIRVLPNPASNVLNIQNLDGGRNLVALYDISGKKMTELITTAIHQRISIATYANGIYLLRIINASGKVTTIRVVKQ